MTDRSANTGDQGGEQLFKNMDEQERLYAPEQVPDADLPPGEADRGGTAASGTGAAGGTVDTGDTPVAVPLGTGGGIAATPPSDAYDPGMDREERDMATGEAGIVGPDTRDEQVKPAGSVTQERNQRS